jgi:hypothetical protein
VASSATVHAVSGNTAMASLSWLVRANPTENSICRPRCSRSDRRCANHALVAPAPSARIRIGVPYRYASGICANASSVTLMWSAAALAFAFPGRSIPANASPVWSSHASSG